MSAPAPGAVRAADVVAPDETAGLPVAGAAVAVTSVPAGLVAAPPQQATDTSGATTVRLRLTSRLRIGKGRLVLAVHVRKPGAPWTDGVSGLRLVSVRTAAR